MIAGSRRGGYTGGRVQRAAPRPAASIAAARSCNQGPDGFDQPPTPIPHAPRMRIHPGFGLGSVVIVAGISLKCGCGRTCPPGSSSWTSSASGPTTGSRPPPSSPWCPPGTNEDPSSSLPTRSSASGENSWATPSSPRPSWTGCRTTAMCSTSGGRATGSGTNGRPGCSPPGGTLPPGRRQFPRRPSLTESLSSQLQTFSLSNCREVGQF